MINRSRSYLTFIFREFGKTFISELNLIRDNYEVYFMDLAHIYYVDNSSNCLYLVVDVNCKGFVPFMKVARNSKYHVYDYPLIGRQVFAFSVPESFNDTLYYFSLSKYSKMYTPEQLKRINLPVMKGGQHSFVWCVLHGSNKRLDKLELLTRQRFNLKEDTVLDFSNIEEFDLPWVVDAEILNLKYEN